MREQTSAADDWWTDVLGELFSARTWTLVTLWWSLKTFVPKLLCMSMEPKILHSFQLEKKWQENEFIFPNMTTLMPTSVHQPCFSVIGVNLQSPPSHCGDQEATPLPWGWTDTKIHAEKWSDSETHIFCTMLNWRLDQCPLSCSSMIETPSCYPPAPSCLWHDHYNCYNYSENKLRDHTMWSQTWFIF